MPDNYQLSLYRLQVLLCRLKQDSTVLKEYDDTIKEQLKKGIIENVPPDRPAEGKIHYLPHHAVVRQDKSTTKVRIVYDASARSGNDPSLNDCLMKDHLVQPTHRSIIGAIPVLQSSPHSRSREGILNGGCGRSRPQWA